MVNIPRVTGEYAFDGDFSGRLLTAFTVENKIAEIIKGFFRVDRVI